MSVVEKMSQAEGRRLEFERQATALERELAEHQTEIESRIRDDAVGEKPYPAKDAERDRREVRELQDRLAAARRSREIVDAHIADLKVAELREHRDGNLRRAGELADEASQVFDEFSGHYSRALELLERLKKLQTAHHNHCHNAVTQTSRLVDAGRPDPGCVPRGFPVRVDAVTSAMMNQARIDVERARA